MSPDEQIEGLFLVELTAEIAGVLDRVDVSSAEFEAVIVNVARQGRLPLIQLAFARLVGYRYTADFLADTLAAQSWAPHFVRLVNVAGGTDEDAAWHAVNELHRNLSDQEMWTVTQYLCELGHGLFTFTGGFGPFLQACQLHSRAVADRGRQGHLVEPAALIIAMLAAGYPRAAGELLERFLPSWDVPALFTLWLGVVARLAPNGRLSILTVTDGVPQSISRSDIAALPGEDEIESQRLILDVITAVRDGNHSAVGDITARILGKHADQRLTLLLELAEITASSLPNE